MVLLYSVVVTDKILGTPSISMINMEQAWFILANIHVLYNLMITREMKINNCVHVYIYKNCIFMLRKYKGSLQYCNITT